MKIETFDDDLIGVLDFSEKLEGFIRVEHKYVDGSLVVALNAKFGGGKSTFLQMWSNALKSKAEESGPVVITINAWESDYYGDPLFALISALSEVIEDTQKSKLLIDVAQDIGWLATALGSQIVKKYTGLDLLEAEKVVKSKKKKSVEEVLVPDTFSVFEARKAAMVKLKEVIKEIFGGDQPKAWIFVDELDRCRPDYAVTYLETIKHIFDIKGLVFVLAIDRRQLETSVKTAFGIDLDFPEYYRKFVHREVSFPRIKEEGYRNIAKVYVNQYLDVEGQRISFANIDSDRQEDIVDLISAVRLTPRQIQDVFRILGHIFETQDENRKGRLRWGRAVGSILMATLKISSPEMYEALGNGNLRAQEAYEFFSRLAEKSRVEWWLMICFTGGGLRESKTDEEQMLREAGLLSEDDSYQGSSGSFANKAWGDPGVRDRFKEIHNSIEEVLAWG